MESNKLRDQPPHFSLANMAENTAKFSWTDEEFKFLLNVKNEYHVSNYRLWALNAIDPEEL